MLCLTVCQPYAHLLIRGDKRVENRKWPAWQAPMGVKGLRFPVKLAIHAGMSKDWLEDCDYEEYGIAPDELVFGAVIGYATLAACVRYEAPGDAFAWVKRHEHASGPWCWVLENPVKLPEPVAIRGRQGIFQTIDFDRPTGGPIERPAPLRYLGTSRIEPRTKYGRLAIDLIGRFPHKAAALVNEYQRECHSHTRYGCDVATCELMGLNAVAMLAQCDIGWDGELCPFDQQPAVKKGKA